MSVATLEEEEYPQYYYKTIIEGEDGEIEEENGDIKGGDGKGAEPAFTEAVSGSSPKPDDTYPVEQHLSFQENQKGDFL